MYGYEICSAGNCLSVFVDTYTTIYIYTVNIVTMGSGRDAIIFHFMRQNR